MNSEKITIDKLNLMQDDEWIALLETLRALAMGSGRSRQGRPFPDKKALQARFEGVIFGR